MRLSVLLLMVMSSIVLYSQNLIVNPDFSDVAVVYQNGKKVYPKYWKAFDWPFPAFYYSENMGSGDVLEEQANGASSKGIVGLNILHKSEGICTKLMKPLKLGQVYDVEVELRIEKVNLNSDAKGVRNQDTNARTDSADLDYNYVVDLITSFSQTEENYKNYGKRSFVILDFPANVTPDTTGWIKLSQSYTAKGDEEYFAIGTGSFNDYVEILRSNKNDTVDYGHKFAYYSIRDVSIFPHVEKKTTDLSIVDNFEALPLERIEERFVFLKVNFESNSSELNDESKVEINKIAAFMKSNLDLNLHVVGHTDTIGTVQYNQTLSEHRAKAVCEYLTSQGIDNARLSYEGKGKSQPLDNSQQQENLGRSRRVEFEFKKKKQ